MSRGKRLGVFLDGELEWSGKIQARLASHLNLAPGYTREEAEETAERLAAWKE